MRGGCLLATAAIAALTGAAANTPTYGVVETTARNGLCAKPEGLARCWLAKSTAGEVRRLRRKDVHSGREIIVARSYDGAAWEGVLPQPLRVTCTDGVARCYFMYDGTAFVYDVVSITVTPPTGPRAAHAAAAKLLTQFTFGARRRDVARLAAKAKAGAGGFTAAATSWFDEQTALPPTLAAAYFRARTSPRDGEGMEGGPTFEPCDWGSRWHRYALATRDQGKAVVFSKAGDRRIATLGDGAVLTEIDAATVDAAGAVTGTRYTVCSVVERVGGEVVLARASAGCGAGDDERVLLANPAIAFARGPQGYGMHTVLNAGKAANPDQGKALFQPPQGVGSRRADVKILRQTTALCSADVPSAAEDVYFANVVADGDAAGYHRYDRRVRLIRNTIEAPTDLVTKAATTPGTMCATAAATFLNSGSCSRRNVDSECGRSTCGARAEVANNPILGNRYPMFHKQGDSGSNLQATAASLDWPQNGWHAQSAVFHNLALKSEDQLRLRVAWALIQIVPVSLYGLGHELDIGIYQNYMDIFIANAFGNYWDVLREVSFSPMMGAYLSFRGNKAFASGGTLPDQNYAREVMQLFSIGLYKLNMDGSEVQQWGGHVPTYTTRDIVSLARAWTGFDSQDRRGNIQSTYGNFYDPMDINSADRDALPKTDIADGYLGDGYPLCEDAPKRAFLKKGAKYVYVGESPIEGDAVGRYATVDYKDLNPGNGVTIVVAGPAECAPWSFCATLKPMETKRARFRVPIEETNVHVPGSQGIQVWLHGDNGARLMVRRVEHYALQGKRFEWSPLPYNNPKMTVEDFAEMVAEFNKLFPVGTTITVHNSPVVGRGPPTGEIYTPAVRSPLHGALCAARGGGAACTFPQEVTLQKDLACPAGDVFCQNADALQGLAIRDTVAGTTRYYVHQPRTCVKLAVFDGGEGRLVAYRPCASCNVTMQCAPARLPTAGAACCHAGDAGADPVMTVAYAPPQCHAHGEIMRWQTAKDRCEALGHTLCEDVVPNTGLDFRTTCGLLSHTWFGGACGMTVQVYRDGLVGLVVAADNVDPRFAVDSENTFYPRWAGGKWPLPEAPPAGCELQGNDTLVCNVATEIRTVFATAGEATREAVAARLRVGAYPPSTATGFACLAGPAACDAADIAIWRKADGATTPGTLDASSIIGIRQPAHHGGGYHYYRNIEPTVRVGNGAAAATFRNPPAFMPLSGETVSRRDRGVAARADFFARHAAFEETDALLKHLFRHQNTAPFISRLLIQRLVTSNPSPRYIEAVATAFATGNYGGRGSGRYGCLKATAAAIVLDREARSETLDADPGHGATREPLLRVLQVLRSLEYQTRDGQDLNMQDLPEKIGMDAHNSPSVFGFYHPDFSPKGVVARAGLVSPEAALAPQTISMLNGLSSLVQYGMTSCFSGLGHWSVGPGKQARGLCKQAEADGRLTLDPRDVSDGLAVSALPDPPRGLPDRDYAAFLLEQYDLVLTGGRLSDASRAAILDNLSLYTPELYDTDLHACDTRAGYHLEKDADCGKGTKCDVCRHSTREGRWPPRTCVRHPAQGVPYIVASETDLSACQARPDAALEREHVRKGVLELLLVAPEFHTTNLRAAVADAPRRASYQPPPRDKTSKYKAVVAIMLEGGADSFNYMIPASCKGPLGYGQYRKRRGVATLHTRHLDKVDVPEEMGQPCSSFYIPKNLTNVRTMYEEGDAALFMNFGSLVEPVDRRNLTTAKLPPFLFAHNTQQQTAQSLHGQDGSAKGVLGRMADHLQSGRTNVYTVGQYHKIAEGEDATPTVLDQRMGTTHFGMLDEHREAIERLVSEPSRSLFAESFASDLQRSLDISTELGALLEASPGIDTEFEQDNSVGRSMRTISRIMKLRDAQGQRLADRDVFSFSISGFDTHNEAYEPWTRRLDNALGAFKQEMIAQGVWDDVVVMVYSDFGRTLTSNGKGTDHGWGGNYFAVGGGLRPQAVLGRFPSSLDGSDLHDYGHGIMIPSTPYEGMWAPVADWLGVPKVKWPKVFPNLGNFTELNPQQCDIFDVECDSPRGKTGGAVEETEEEGGGGGAKSTVLIYTLTIAAVAIIAAVIIFTKVVRPRSGDTKAGNANACVPYAGNVRKHSDGQTSQEEPESPFYVTEPCQSPQQPMRAASFTMPPRLPAPVTHQRHAAMPGMSPQMGPCDSPNPLGNTSNWASPTGMLPVPKMPGVAVVSGQSGHSAVPSVSTVTTIALSGTQSPGTSPMQQGLAAATPSPPPPPTGSQGVALGTESMRSPAVMNLAGGGSQTEPFGTRLTHQLIAQSAFRLTNRGGDIIQEMIFNGDGRAKTRTRASGGTWELRNGDSGYPVLVWWPHAGAAVQIQLMSSSLFLVPPVPQGFCPVDARVSMLARGPPGDEFNLSRRQVEFETQTPPEQPLRRPASFKAMGARKRTR